MINLKKLFKRKKGQGALEYLFMIAAALIIIFVVVRYISGSTQQASSQSDIASLQSQVELIKSKLVSQNVWDDQYTVEYDSTNDYLLVKDTNGTVAYAEADKDYSAAPYSTLISSTPTLGSLYDKCMVENDATACEIIVDIGDDIKLGAP
ncbi:class III signal peptide-containing protein [Thermococcus alcaliphilus]|uniref:class III signal peptide-containing protein n=1 Tax=Thermococcus alcaliphilus TaxID=139207 RepID=UPI00338E454B